MQHTQACASKQERAHTDRDTHTRTHKSARKQGFLKVWQLQEGRPAGPRLPNFPGPSPGDQHKAYLGCPGSFSRESPNNTHRDASIRRTLGGLLVRNTPSAGPQFRGPAGPGRTSLTYLGDTVYLGRGCPLAAPARTRQAGCLLGKRIWVAHHLQAPAPRATVLAQVEEDGRGQGGIRERFPVRVPTARILLFVPGTRATSISGEIVKADEGFGLGVLLGILLLGSSRNILVHPPASRPRSEQVAEGKMLREAGALSGVKPRRPWAEQGDRGKETGFKTGRASSAPSRAAASVLLAPLGSRRSWLSASRHFAVCFFSRIPNQPGRANPRRRRRRRQ